MPFYRPTFTEAWRLTMASAFVRSGALWAPFSAVATLFVLVLIVAFALLFFGRKRFTASLSKVISSLVLASLVAGVTTLTALVVVYGFELLVYAPRAVLRDIADRSAKTASERQASLDTSKYKAEIGDLKQKVTDAMVALDQARRSQSQAYLEFEKPQLIASHRERKILITTKIYNSGTTSADNVVTIGSVVFGDGPDAQLIEGTLYPPIRIVPSEKGLALSYGIDKKDRKRIAAVLSLIDRKQPMVLTVDLYFTVNGVQYSQRSVRSYDYDNKMWKVTGDQVVPGFVPLPSAVYRGTTRYFAAPWLPTPPNAPICSAPVPSA